MKNIQSKVNVINRHGQYFTRKARSGLREILEERLRALNEQWDKLQDQASARQKDLEQLVQERTDNELLTGEDSSLNALRSNTALLSSLYFNTENEDIKRLLNRLGLFSADDEECEKMQHLEDDYLDYQASFHDLFEWLTATEEVIANIPTTHCQLSQLRDRLKDLQVLYLAVVTKPFASLSVPFGNPLAPLLEPVGTLSKHLRTLVRSLVGTPSHSCRDPVGPLSEFRRTLVAIVIKPCSFRGILFLHESKIYSFMLNCFWYHLIFLSW